MASRVPWRNVGILGVPIERNSSFLRGMAASPQLIRTALASDSWHHWSELGVNTKPLFGDPGNDEGNMDPDDTIEAVAERAAEIHAKGTRLLTFGGDHSISHPLVKACCEAHGQRLSILHFDAHTDLYGNYEGKLESHATPFARILEGGYAADLIQIGIRSIRPSLRKQAAKFGVDMIEARHYSIDRVRESLAPLISRGSAREPIPVYVSFDLDCLDPSVAPGVSHHEPGGLSVRDFMDVMDIVFAEPAFDLVGADVVELNPIRDVAHDPYGVGQTAMVAAKIARELGAGMLASLARYHTHYSI